MGLGTVTPGATAGIGANFDPLNKTASPVSVLIGGVPAHVDFAGLTPGAVGLYQINATVPSGIAPGPKVPVTVSVRGKSGPESVYMGVR